MQPTQMGYKPLTLLGRFSADGTNATLPKLWNISIWYY